MSGLALHKPWIPLTAGAVAAVPAQLGVYEIGDDRGVTLRIGYAGGREPFGMRSALGAQLKALGAQLEALGAQLEAGVPGARFRYELTHGYLTRWEELLMLHRAEHGDLPPGNADRLHPVGRLRP